MRLRPLCVALLVGASAQVAAALPAAADGSTARGPVAAVRIRSHATDPEPVVLAGARTDGRRRLVLSFTGAAPVTDRKDACRLDYAATADAGRDAVTVAVAPVYRAVHRAGASVACDALGFSRTETVRLDRPLRSRTVVDAATGDPVPVFDGATRLRPGWLPAGWAPEGEHGGGCWSSSLVPCWNQTWGTPESEDPAACPSGPGYVQLSQAVGPTDPGVFSPSDAVTSAPATVRGVPAEVLVDSRGLGSVVVRWNEGDQSLVLYGGSACAGAPAPSAEVVTRIADSLR